MIKKIGRISMIVLGLIIVALLTVPLAFKGKIITLVKNKANQQLNVTVDFSGYHVTLLRSFPHLTMKIDDLTLVGKEQFEDDTLIHAGSLFLTLDLRSLFADRYEIRNIRLENVQCLLMIAANGEPNWDILKDAETEPVSESQEAAAGSFRLALRHARINKAYLVYQDDELGMRIQADHLQAAFSGDLTANRTQLNTQATIGELSVDYNQLPLLQKVAVRLSSDIDADLVNEKYTFSDTELLLNEIQLLVDGYWSVPGDAVEMDVRLKTVTSDFKQLLSLIPSIYKRDYARVNASGTFAIDGFLQGSYRGDTLPSFGFNLQVDNGMFQYPDLPSRVDDIRMNVGIGNPGGHADLTVISVESLHMSLSGNPIDASLTLTHPVSDPMINFVAKGKLDLGTIGHLYPLKPGQELSGIIQSDLAVKGQVSDFEDQNFSAIDAHGTFRAEQLNIGTDAAGKPLIIQRLDLAIHPEMIDLKSFAFTYGANDLTAQGTLTNTIPYLIKGELLTGTFTTFSRFIHLDSIIESIPAGETPQATATPAAGTARPVTVPANLDLRLNSTLDRLIYNGMDIKNVKGTLAVQNGEMKIDGLTMDLLGGSLTLDARYTAADPNPADAEISLQLKGLDVQQSYNSMALMHDFVPVAEKTRGSYSARLGLRTRLNQQMQPILESVSGTGSLSASKIVIEDIQVLNRIVEVLKVGKLKNAAIDALDFRFELLDGKAHVSPFTFFIGSISTTLSGFTSLDKDMNYIMNLVIPREEFGSQFNTVMDGLAGQMNKAGIDLQPGEKVHVDVIIGGTITQPTVKIGLKEAMSGTVEDLKAKVEEEFQERKQELESKAREEAQRYMAKVDSAALQLTLEAEARAGEIKALARQSAQKIRTEADSAAAKLIAEGKKKGPLAEMAAKTAAGELKKEASDNADRVIREADQQAENLVNQAKANAEAMRKEARSKFQLNE